MDGFGLLFMYTMNVIIFIFKNDNFINNKEDSFFRMLNSYKINTYKFMLWYRKVIIGGGVVIMIFSLFFIFKAWFS